MERKKVLMKAFQRGHLLNLRNDFYRNWIKKFILDETKGDIGILGDITSNALFNGNSKVMAALLKSRSNGIVSGLEEVTFLYSNNRIKVKSLKKDGDRIRKGDILVKLRGKEKDLLRMERSASDLLERMSGISTLTHNLISKIDKKVLIAPTRKTQWRYLDKKAVYVGGGLTHRLALWESILIKDNHLKILSRITKDPVSYSLEKAWKNRKRGNFIEIEVTEEKQALNAAKIIANFPKSNIPFLIMLDNMNPSRIKSIISKLKRNNLFDKVLIEASGGINPDNIVSYSKTGVDVLSLGYLTNSVKSLNIKQEIV